MIVFEILIKLLSVIKLIFKSLLDILLERAIDRTVPSKENSHKEKIREIQKNRFLTISNKDYDLSWQYNDIIIENYVNRRFHYYSSDKEKKEFNIKYLCKLIQNRSVFSLMKAHELEKQKEKVGVVIITGKAGSGKSTALKYLYVKTNKKEPNYIFYYSRQFTFEKYPTLESVLAFIENDLHKRACSCTVFIDGLDELPCIKGNTGELGIIATFFNRMNNSDEGHHRFIVSSRSEHFDFSNSIRKYGIIKNTEGKTITPDNWLIIETSVINAKETLRICKSIKYLCKFDNNLGGGHYRSHFRDKWPEKNSTNNEMSERAYLRLLKKYIISNNEEQTLLSSPLLCRYAYPIICEWRDNSNIIENEDSGSESQRIDNIISFYVKWEFHDHFTGSTKTEQGKKQLEDYTTLVYDFLTEISGKMGLDYCIPQHEWATLKDKYKIVLNAAFCVLQEENDGKLYFIHSSFQEFFRVLYFIKKTNRRIRPKDLLFLDVLLETNSLFSIMYAEQICCKGTKLAKVISEYMIKKIGEKDKKKYIKLARYICGESFLLDADAPFTIEEYLSVFYKGHITYGGIIFDVQTYKDFKTSGILKSQSIYQLDKIKPERYGKNTIINGIITEIIYRDEKHKYNHIKTSFGYIIDGNYSGQIFMYSHETERSKKPLERYYDDYNIGKEMVQERKMLEEDMLRMASFLTDSKNVWMLYYGFSFYVLTICESNSHIFSRLYLSILEKGENSINLIAIYCDYCSDLFKLHFKCYDIKKISFSFYGSFKNNEYSILEKKYQKVVKRYNSIWWRESNLINSIFEDYDESPDLNRIVFNESMNKLVLIIQEFISIMRLFDESDNPIEDDIISDVLKDLLLLEFTKEVFEFLNEIGTSICSLPEDYLILSLSDLLIILFYFIQYNNGICLIRNTTEQICIRNNYQGGIELRKRMLEPDYSIQTIKWLKSYLLCHVWINV